MDIDRIIKRLEKAENTYHSAVERVARMIEDKVEFDFFIQYQPADGFTLVAASCARVAPLDACLRVIERSGTLRENEFLGLCI